MTPSKSVELRYRERLLLVLTNSNPQVFDDYKLTKTLKRLQELDFIRSNGDGQKLTAQGHAALANITKNKPITLRKAQKSRKPAKAPAEKNEG